MENLIIFISVISVLILTSSVFLLFINFKYKDIKSKTYEYNEEDELDSFLSEEELKQLEEDYLSGINYFNENKKIDFNKVYEINTIYSVRDKEQKINNILK